MTNSMNDDAQDDTPAETEADPQSEMPFKDQMDLARAMGQLLEGKANTGVAGALSLLTAMWLSETAKGPVEAMEVLACVTSNTVRHIESLHEHGMCAWRQGIESQALN